MKNIPEGFHSVTPYLVLKDAAGAIELYTAAFGATSVNRMMMPGSDKIIHACLQIGSSKIFLCDEDPQQGMLAADDPDKGPRFYVYFDDVQQQHQQAVSAGMTEVSAPMEMFWGDAMSVLKDPYGVNWSLATHVRDVSEEEMAEAMAQME